MRAKIQRDPSGEFRYVYTMPDGTVCRTNRGKEYITEMVRKQQERLGPRRGRVDIYYASERCEHGHSKEWFGRFKDGIYIGCRKCEARALKIEEVV